MRNRFVYISVIFICSFVLLQESISLAQEERRVHIIEHKVEAGDNLYLLAAYYLENARLWRDIYNENRDKISNPNILETGMILKIPVKKKDWKPKFSIEGWRQKNRK